jgi:hypothetical protein
MRCSLHGLEMEGAPTHGGRDVRRTVLRTSYKWKVQWVDPLAKVSIPVAAVFSTRFLVQRVCVTVVHRDIQFGHAEIRTEIDNRDFGCQNSK